MAAPTPLPFTWKPSRVLAERHLQITKVDPVPARFGTVVDLHVSYRHGPSGPARSARVTLTPDGVSAVDPADGVDTGRTRLLHAITGALTHEALTAFVAHSATANQDVKKDRAELIVAALTLPGRARKVAIVMLRNGYAGSSDDLRTAALAATA